MSAPRTIADLDRRLRDRANEWQIPVSRVRTIVSAIIVAQMLPGDIAIKGGLGIKLRLGELGTRATTDLDAVVPLTSDSRSPYTSTISRLSDELEKGWGVLPPSRAEERRNPAAPNRVAFTGVLRPGEQHDPGVRHPEYLMQPVRVTVRFLGRPWSHVDLELTRPEPQTNYAETIPIDSELAELFDSLEFGPLTDVHILRPEVQIAQKIHALTSPASDRGHDLVDIQLLWTDAVNERLLEESCRLTFSYRQEHQWPPLPLRDMTADRERYRVAAAEARLGVPESAVRIELDDAVSWLSSKIESIAHPTAPHLSEAENGVAAESREEPRSGRTTPTDPGGRRNLLPSGAVETEQT